MYNRKVWQPRNLPGDNFPVLNQCLIVMSIACFITGLHEGWLACIISSSYECNFKPWPWWYRWRVSSFFSAPPSSHIHFYEFSMAIISFLLMSFNPSCHSLSPSRRPHPREGAILYLSIPPINFLLSYSFYVLQLENNLSVVSPASPGEQHYQRSPPVIHISKLISPVFSYQLGCEHGLEYSRGHSYNWM